MKRIVGAIGFVGALLSTAAFAEPGRLPAGVTPLAYDIMVDPDAAKLRFTGRETITIAVAAPTRTITLNAADLTFARVVLDGQTPAQVTTNATDQTATFTFATPVTAGQHRLAIDYAGKIYQTASGLFALDYTNDDGSKERLLVTQFEAPDARRFAAMWDEPGFKTPITLSAMVPNGQTAFSNMPVDLEAAGAGPKHLVKFKPTPAMSSYLMFLGIGNVERRTVMAGRTEIGMITRKGVVAQGDYALASAKRVLAAYNDYFGVPYPLPKLDMIAGPGSSQFFGAMENWGAILYFERVVLLDPKLQTEDQKQDVFNVVAHEMAHQWFGDLVTMKWWDDLWLNEGFASWMASKISGDLNPTWHATSQSVAFDRQGAMARDGRATTHPIIQKVTTVDQISDAFDDITYRKGEAVIRMLEGSVGPDVFRTGVRRYMAKYQYGNTVTDQLWTEVSAAAGRDVKPMMDSFTRQGGVPLIAASEPVCAAAGTTSLSLVQSRFGLDALSKQPQRWQVPVNLAQAGSAEVTRTMVNGGAPTVATLPGCGTPVVNAGQSAYFRTLYAPGHFAKLTQAFATLALDDQVGLVADAYGLANSGDVSIARYLGLVDTLPATADPLVWQMVTSELSGVDGILSGTPEQPAFRAKAARVLAPVMARIGWTERAGEAPAVAQLRSAIIPALGSFGDASVRATAAGYAQAALANPASVPGTIRVPALSVYAKALDAPRWEALHARAVAERSPVLKSSLYNSLASVADPVLAQRVLDLALTDEAPVPVRTEMIRAVSASHPALAFDWAVAHADAVNKLLEASSAARFIPGLASNANETAVATRVDAYVTRALPATARGPGKVAINTITYRAGLRRMHAAAIAKWASQ